MRKKGCDEHDMVDNSEKFVSSCRKITPFFWKLCPVL